MGKKRAYAPIGPAGVIGEGAHPKDDQATWETRGMLGCSAVYGDSFLVDACVKRSGRAGDGQKVHQATETGKP